MNAEDAARALHAYVDGELDAVSSLELEAELASNPSLRAAHERLRELSASVRADAEYYAAPARLKEAPEAEMSAAPPAPRRRFATTLVPAFALAAMLAVAVGVGLFPVRPGGDEALSREAAPGPLPAGPSGRRTVGAPPGQHQGKPPPGPARAVSPPGP